MSMAVSSYLMIVVTVCCFIDNMRHTTATAHHLLDYDSTHPSIDPRTSVSQISFPGSVIDHTDRIARLVLARHLSSKSLVSQILPQWRQHSIPESNIANSLHGQRNMVLTSTGSPPPSLLAGAWESSHRKTSRSVRTPLEICLSRD